jgi:hypothetical protein
MSDNQRDVLFELVAYFITCAHRTLEEAPRYGALRMVEGARRLIEAAEGVDGVEVDDFARECSKSINENLWHVMNEYPRFEQWLADLTESIATEATRRQLEAPAS